MEESGLQLPSPIKPLTNFRKVDSIIEAGYRHTDMSLINPYLSMNHRIQRKLARTLAGVLALGTSSARAEFEITAVRLADGGATVVLEFTSLTGMNHRDGTNPAKTWCSKVDRLAKP